MLVHGDLPTLKPAAGEVLIRVLAAGLNWPDHYLREGTVTRDLVLPHVLGSDAAGCRRSSSSGYHEEAR